MSDVLVGMRRTGQRTERRPALGSRLFGDESGATGLEYGLIVGGIAIAILATIFAMGDDMSNMFTSFQTRIGDSLEDAFK